MNSEELERVNDIVNEQQPADAVDLIESGFFDEGASGRSISNGQTYDRTISASCNVGGTIVNTYSGWTDASTLREEHITLTVKDGKVIEVVESKRETQMYRGISEKWETVERELPNQVVTFIFEDESGHKETFSAIGGSETLMDYWNEYCYRNFDGPLNMYDTLESGEKISSSGETIKISAITSDGQPISTIKSLTRYIHLGNRADNEWFYDGRYQGEFVPKIPRADNGTEPIKETESPITIDPIESTYGDYYIDQLKTYNENYDSAKTKITTIVSKLTKVYDSFNEATGVDISKIKTDLTTIIDSLNTIETKISTKQQKTNDNADSCRRCYKKWFFKQYDQYVNVHINYDNGRVAAYKYNKDDTEHEPKDRKGDYIEATIEEMLNS